MASDSRTTATDIVAAMGGEEGKVSASAEQLMPLVYDELHRLAERFMRGERTDHTLQPTALVHEAYLKLVDQSRVSWQGRTHFLAVGAQAMRRILIDHARGHGRAKRGAGWRRITLTHEVLPSVGGDLDVEQLLSLNAALEKLAQLDERQARIVVLRFFGGLDVAEVASVLGVSKRTAEGDWTFARAWLRRELAGDTAG